MKFIFLRGEAYINQLLEFSRELYERLDGEFMEIFGFTYQDVEKAFIYSFQQYVRNVELIDSRIEEISKEIIYKQEIPPALKYERFIDLMKDADFEISLQELYKVIDKQSCKNIIDRLGSKVGELNIEFDDIKAFNELLAKPIVRLESDKILFPIIINSIMNLPKMFHYDFLGIDKILEDKTRAKEIKGLYGEVRGDVVENLSVKYLSRIFDTKNILNSLKYGRKFNDEADITITYQDIAILIECKGKLMTLVALQGNYDKIKSDFDLAVQKAYNQSYRTQQYILNNGDFKDEEGNIVKISKPNKFFKICIVSDYLGHLGTNPELLNLFDEDYPLVLNIYDLDYITKNVSNEEEFVNYIEFRLRRRDIQNMDELELFNYYVNSNEHEFDINENRIILPVQQMLDTDMKNGIESYEYIMNYNFK